MTKKQTILLFSILVGLFLNVAADKKEIRIATLTDYPPACFPKNISVLVGIEVIPPGKDSDILQGKSWEIVREAYHSQGYTIVLHTVPIARALHYVANGTVDVIFPFVKTEERLTTFSFSQEPVVTDSILIYYPKSIKKTVMNASMFHNKKIAVIRQWAYGRVWEKETTVQRIEADSIMQCFNLLDGKWVDGVVGYETAFDYSLKSLGFANKYNKTPPFDHVTNFMMGLQTKEASIFLNAYDQGYHAIKKNGTYDKIIQKWK